MGQFKHTNLRSSMVLVHDGPCQLTSYHIDNTLTGSSDVYVHFKDSADTTSAATGATGAYKIYCPAGEVVVLHINSGSTEDPDGIWAFQTGMTIKCVTGRPDSSNTSPPTAVEVYLQYKP